MEVCRRRQLRRYFRDAAEVEAQGRRGRHFRREHGRRVVGSTGRSTATTTATGTGFLAGQVIEVPSGRPIAGALVSIGAPGSGRGGLGPVLTDSQGRFFFANLPAAAVASFASKIGYTSLSGARRVELVAGGRITDLKIRLVKLATMAGAVRDDAGDPVVGNEMRVFRRTITDGQAAWRPLGLTRTDDRGDTGSAISCRARLSSARAARIPSPSIVRC